MMYGRTTKKWTHSSLGERLGNTSVVPEVPILNGFINQHIIVCMCLLNIEVYRFTIFIRVGIQLLLIYMNLEVY